MTHALLAACGGFLLAVLWMDLMFDVQALRHRRDPLPAPVLDSIVAYYGRVTTGASPMGRLVGLVMLAALAAIVAWLVRGDAPRSAAWLSLALAAPPVVLAQARIFPNAVKLGAGAGSPAERASRGRSLARTSLVLRAWGRSRRCSSRSQRADRARARSHAIDAGATARRRVPRLAFARAALAEREGFEPSRRSRA